MKTYQSREYWNNYIDSIISSIQEDKDTIIDILIFGRLENAKIIMNLSAQECPSYKIQINKIAEKSPFGEDEEE